MQIYENHGTSIFEYELGFNFTSIWLPSIVSAPFVHLCDQRIQSKDKKILIFKKKDPLRLTMSSN